MLAPGERLYDRGDAADRSFVVAEGTGRLDGEPVAAGALLGEEALGVSARYRTEAVSDGMTVICVPSQPVMELADVSSALGVELIRHAAGAYGVRAL